MSSSISPFQYANTVPYTGITGPSPTSCPTYGIYTTNNTNLCYSTSPTYPSLTVDGDMEINGNLKFKGRNLEKLLESIESRLAIITEPSPEKLEKFEALKKAYDHYKLMEKLIGEE